MCKRDGYGCDEELKRVAREGSSFADGWVDGVAWGEMAMQQCFLALLLEAGVDE